VAATGQWRLQGAGQMRHGTLWAVIVVAAVIIVVILCWVYQESGAWPR